MPDCVQSQYVNFQVGLSLGLEEKNCVDTSDPIQYSFLAPYKAQISLFFFPLVFSHFLDIPTPQHTNKKARGEVFKCLTSAINQ